MECQSPQDNSYPDLEDIPKQVTQDEISGKPPSFTRRILLGLINPQKLFEENVEGLVHSLPSFDVVLANWTQEMMDQTEDEVLRDELNELAQDIEYGELGERLTKARNTTIVALGISLTTPAAVLLVSGVLTSAGQVLEIPTLRNTGLALTAYEGIPGLGGISALARVGYTIAKYSIPLAKEYREHSHLGQNTQKPYKKIIEIIKTAALGGYPVLTFFDGGWVLIPVPEIIRNRTGRKVVAWKLKNSLKERGNKTTLAVKRLNDINPDKIQRARDENIRQADIMGWPRGLI